MEAEVRAGGVGCSGLVVTGRAAPRAGACGTSVSPGVRSSAFLQAPRPSQTSLGET